MHDRSRRGTGGRHTREARELAALLLERGAEPYDVQVLYNGFAGHASQRLLADDDFVWLLELIYRESIKRGRAGGLERSRLAR